LLRAGHQAAAADGCSREQARGLPPLIGKMLDRLGGNMKEILFFLVLVFLVGFSFSEVVAQDELPQLQFSYDLHTVSNDDSVHVTFLVHGTNVSDSPLEVCGAFYFSCVFYESTGTAYSSEHCNRFLVLDKKIGALLQCDPRVVEVGEAVEDTLKFTFRPSYFGDCSGSIKMNAEFTFGNAGDELNDAKKVGGDLLRVFLPIN
jgi:hypothetical protein